MLMSAYLLQPTPGAMDSERASLLSPQTTEEGGGAAAAAAAASLETAEATDYEPRTPLGLAWFACIMLSVLLFGLLVGEVDPTRIDTACGTGLWPLCIGRIVCVVLFSVLEWLELTHPPPIFNVLMVAYHFAFTVTFAVTIQAAGIAADVGSSPCLRAMEEAATVTHSYALAITAWLWMAWDALLTLLLLWVESLPPSAAVVPLLPPPAAAYHFG
jgi:hypothetical protein